MTYSVNFNRVRKNVDLYKVFRLTTPGTPPAPLPFKSGIALKMQIKRVIGDQTPILTLTLGNGLTIVDGDDGRFAVDLDSATLSGLPDGTFKHDLVLERYGHSEVVWEGKFKIKSGVTQL